MVEVSRFYFDLPESLIATHPVEPRDASRLLHVAGGGVSDLRVTNLPGLLRPNDILLLNNTRVIPARVFAKRGEGAIEILLHKPLSEGSWEAFAKPAKKLKTGDDLFIAENFSCTVIQKHDDGQVRIQFLFPKTVTLEKMLEQHGTMPLPPYIAKKRAADKGDETTYQTVFAKYDGSVAAPTAGLHFTTDLLETIKAKGVQLAYVTLHVGAGTFLPMKADDTKDHKMHSEWCEVPLETAEAVNKAKANGGRVIPVGTTALRTLESAADDAGWLHPFTGETDIFITPGYEFKIADCLFTNFHTPRSTLFMLVCAFAGEERMKAAYAHAIERGYRFYSYGDACFLERP